MTATCRLCSSIALAVGLSACRGLDDTLEISDGVDSWWLDDVDGEDDSDADADADADSDSDSDADTDSDADADPVAIEDCSDGLDNDGDGLVDCEDQGECSFASSCQEGFGLCTDGLDNDGDGAVDCDDSECFDNGACHELKCHDTYDNDADGLIDCADPDCGWVSASACDTEGSLWWGWLLRWGCNDELDNDGDGLVDCADPDCDSSGCHETLCDDGRDEPDRDGLADCADPDCQSDVSCLHDCGGNTDPDGDGATGCEDPACASSEPCVERHCTDGIDGDADGHTDFADPDCQTPETLAWCHDGIDNDADGLIDCNDPDCPPSFGCEQDCSNGLDDDIDGWVDCDDLDCAKTSCAEICDDGADNDMDGLIDCEDADCALSETCSERCDNHLDDDDDGLVDCWDDDCFGLDCAGATRATAHGVGLTKELRQVDALFSYNYTHLVSVRRYHDVDVSWASGTVQIAGGFGSVLQTCSWQAQSVRFSQSSGQFSHRRHFGGSAGSFAPVRAPASRGNFSVEAGCMAEGSWLVPAALAVAPDGMRQLVYAEHAWVQADTYATYLFRPVFHREVVPFTSQVWYPAAGAQPLFETGQWSTSTWFRGLSYTHSSARERNFATSWDSFPTPGAPYYTRP